MNNIVENKFDSVIVFETSDYQWGVKDLEGNIIVPAGKYGWIDGFDHGLARVRTHKDPGRAGSLIGIVNLEPKDGEPDVISGKENVQAYINKDKSLHPENYAKWGIINEKGEEVLPVEYDDVWNFKGKGRLSTRVVKDGQASEVNFHDLNPDILEPSSYSSDTEGDWCDYDRPHYEEYAGSYAQDVEGYSDEDIDDAFDGDPDAYWNID